MQDLRMSDIPPEAARDYVARWALANDAEVEELRRTTMDTKVRQLASLMASRAELTEEPARSAEAQQVEQRWSLLKQVLGA